MPGVDSVTRLREIHDGVDEKAGSLHRQHSDRLQCRRGCSACCVDDITVFEVEADRIRWHWAEFLASAAPHPDGMCAFLDGEGACRVYAHRPYVCRTQGLPLRWLEERDGATVELRDICHLNEPGEPIEELAVDDCWSLGAIEGELAELQVWAQADADGDRLRRVALRSLFTRSCLPGSPEPG